MFEVKKLSIFLHLLIEEFNLSFVKVQEIWKEIWRAVYLEGNGEHADKESVASLFFQIGHKLDIDQIYHFYRQVGCISNLYLELTETLYLTGLKLTQVI